MPLRIENPAPIVIDPARLAELIATDSAIANIKAQMEEWLAKDMARLQAVKAEIDGYKVVDKELVDVVLKAEAALRAHRKKVYVMKKQLRQRAVPNYFRVRLRSRELKLKHQLEMETIKAVKKEFDKKWGI